MRSLAPYRPLSSASLLSRAARLALVAALAAFAAGVGHVTPAHAVSSLGGIMAHSPDDIGGFSTLSGDDATVNVTLPFTFQVEGTGYTLITLSTNGWIEFGGLTGGGTDFSNDCLPTSIHTNPFLAAYWDDLVTFGTHVRYGTVGSAPNRVFIADYEVDLFGGSEGSDDVRFQVQLHEMSNVITVKYRDSQFSANGQQATIGFQGAGGASADTQPLTCNGKVLDDNRPNEGWAADVGRAGNIVMSAVNMHSPDDLSGFATLSGDDATVNVTMPFSVTIEGTNYSLLTLSTNGWVEFGGGTGGGSDFSNDCLPTPVHTNPFLAAYWDDMQTFGTHIRYGTVGTAPNRVFIADYEVDLFAGNEGADDTRFQIQIHEGSSLINVRYRDSQHAANGQSGTIGFQGAGGASAEAYALGCNAKILDDNQNDRDGWSVHPRELGAISLHGVLAHSPDDITGFATLSGDDATANVTMPFSVAIDGTNYSLVTISTNGWMEFGGGTGGGTDFSNDCLPTSVHTNPFLAAYWDDLKTFGSAVRYGTVGSSPNRVFIADYQTELFSGNEDVRIQVQVHEGSNVITVKYPLAQPGANGQGATLGFQGAGGASAIAHPLVCNGKILDDNRPGEGWSIAPLPVCGNGVVETKEDCDEGAANGTGASCCTSTCDFRGAGQVCRSGSGDVCDPDEACTGGAGTCPGDVVNGGATCRAAADSCDVAEICTGVAGQACPGDAFEPSFVVCRGSAGACDPVENCTGTGPACPGDAKSTAQCRAASGACDVAENCDGVGNDCPADGFASGATQCRASAGACDPAENCTGTGPACPGDAKSTSQCRASAGGCDVAESCDGVSNDCPGDGFASGGTQCRASAGACDPAETCSGTGPSCPGDAKSTAQCRASAGACDLAESCDGVSNDCPADAKSSAQCRASAGACDVAESCDGVGNDCPADAKSTAECRAAADVCDVAEACDGVGNDCPADAFASSATVCRASAGACDVADNCSGTGAACPADAKSSAECRAAADVCDVAEACDGVGNDCPADGFASSATVCRVSAGACDVVDNCSGSGAACPADAKSSAECRAAADVCDVAEACDGVGNDCPADGFASSATVCRVSAGACDVADNCSGTGAACPTDVKSSAECRAAADVCDVAEACDGVGNDCPADGFASSATVCRASAGACDVADNCTGTGAACPADAKSSAECRAAVDVCDVAETCDGIDDDCPADGFALGTQECRASAGACDVAENCTGAGAACPADAKSSAECRAAVDVCDVAETCDGVDDDCPADAFEPVTTECRATADVCDVAETCSGTDAACPADAFEPATTECRAAVGQCDVAEACTGTGAACPGDAFEPDGTACDDTDVCTDLDECTSGVCVGDPATCGDGVLLPLCEICDDGNVTNGDGCDDQCMIEAGIGCFPDPIPGCRQVLADKPQPLFQLKNKANDRGDQLKWKWFKGFAAPIPLEYGDPLTTTDYVLCAYDASDTLILKAHAPAGGICRDGPCWAPLGGGGFKYKDKDGTPDGVKTLYLRGNRVGLLAKGEHLSLPADMTTITQPLTVQIQNSDGFCFEAIYVAPPKKQKVDQFKDKDKP